VVQVAWPGHWSLRLLPEQTAESGWQQQTASGWVAADTTAATTLANRFNDLQVLGSVANNGLRKAIFRLTATTPAATVEHEYRLYHDAKGDLYQIERDDITGRFEIAGYIAEQLMADADSFAPAPAAVGETEQQAPGSPVESDASDIEGLADQMVKDTLQGLVNPE